MAASLLILLLQANALPATLGSERPVIAVEVVDASSALQKAGLQPGDRLTSWRSPFSTGDLRSAFDWLWLTIEHAPRGPIELMGQRGSEAIAFTVEPAEWQAAVRPAIAEPLLSTYLSGKARLEAEDLEGAAELWQELAASADLDADRHLRCWILLRIGQAWSEARDWEAAHVAFRSALDEAHDPLSQVVIQLAIGNAYFAQSRFPQARATYRTAVAISEQAWGESLVLAEIQMALGRVAMKQGELDSAQTSFEDAFRIRETLAPQSLAVAASLNNLGGLALGRGDLNQASDRFRRAVEIRERLAPASLSLAKSLNNLGVVAKRRGRLSEATAYFQRSLEIKRTLEPDSLSLAASLTNLGTVALARGQLDEAEDYFGRALKIREQLTPGSLAVAGSLTNLGIVAKNRGDLEQARELYQQALAIQQELAPTGRAMAATLTNLGNVARIQGELDRARSYYERALEIKRNQAPGSLTVAGTLINLGHVAGDAGELDRAAELYREALGLLVEIAPNSSMEAEARHGLGIVIRQQNRPRTAIEHFRQAIDAFESQIGMLGSSHHVQAGFRATHREYYRDLISVSLELEQSAEAFHTLEQSRAQSFLAQLAERGLGFDAALRHPQPLRAEQVREILDPGTVMLSYSVGEERTDLFVVSRAHGLSVETVDAGEEELQRQVELFRQLIPRAIPGDTFGNYDFERLRETGQRLYSTLIAPVAGSIQQHDRVLIIPDGPLHLLPFGALVRKTTPGATTRRWQYLVEWKPFHSAISATVYAELQRTRRPAPKTGADTRIAFAAFGDPLYSPRLGRELHRGALSDSDADRGALGWKPLPHTRREVEQIAGLFPPEAIRIYLGEDATEERVKAIGRQPRILHIAAHGHLDQRLPLNSFIALTTSEEPEQDRDNGLLQVWEIFERVRLDADLVVLSACRSALGKDLGGEGLLGLTRAFQYAGARSVAATLWSVQDQTTAELMVRFYRHLNAGKATAEALRAAQLELIQGTIRVENDAGHVIERDVAAPYYWAAFQIYGGWK